MENFDSILNSLVAKLLTEGSAEFSQNGLNIKTSYDNGCFNVKASFVSPKVDERVEKLNSDFKEYINSLSDEFFLETVESFEPGVLKNLQDKIESKELSVVRSAVAEFMERLKEVASAKIEAVNSEMKELEKQLTELAEVKNSYIHVLNKKF